MGGECVRHLLDHLSTAKRFASISMCLCMVAHRAAISFLLRVILLSLSFIVLVALPSLATQDDVIRHKDWEVRTVTDEFTDERRIFLNTIRHDTENNVVNVTDFILIGASPASVGKGNSNAILLIKCDKSSAKPYVIIFADIFFGDHSTRNVEYRIDKNKSRKMLMVAASKKLTIANKSKAGSFIQDLRHAQSLIARTNDSQGKTVKLRINIAGFEDVEDKLYGYCARP